MTIRAPIATILLFASVALPLAARAEESPVSADITHIGAAEIFRTDALTVVYPAGPGEDVDRNRRSALHRAAHLRRVTGAGVDVAADDALSASARRGNLLLLGWSNRIVGAEGLAKPFERRARGFRFLDVDVTDPAADLLFYARSPWSDTSFVVFWSRIDPPLDRFMPLPSVGSDWAIVSDFRVTRQGMYLERAAWPPERNPGAESDRELARAKSTEGWTSKKSDHYRLRYDPEALSDSESVAILRARESALARAIETVGEPATPLRIDLHVYADEESKERLSGVADPAHSVPGAGELHMLTRWARSPSPHEEVHLVLRARWGAASLTSIYEGFAVDADGSYRGSDLATHAALLVRENRLPAARTLLDEAAARGLGEEVLFPASGLFVRWIRETAPEAALPEIYRLPDGSAERLARLLGIEPAALDGAFRSHVARAARSKDDEATFRLAQQEAARASAVSDYAGIARAMEKARSVRPDDPQTLFNLASAQLRTREWEDAERHLRRILELPLGETETYFVAFAHYQLGRLFDVQGKRDDALTQYRVVLELPDVHDSHALARRAIDAPVTLESIR